MEVLLRAEEPVLSLEKAVICLHYVEEEALTSPESRAYPDCPVLRSMELDLLSYRFQIDPPFGSQCESHGRLPVEIVFPERLEYQSEGRRVTIACPKPRLRASLITSSTRFLRSGVRVWHAAILPEPGGRFTEFDLIKLVHLYDGRTEATRLAGEVRFVLADGKEAGAADLLGALYPGVLKPVRLLAGTAQLLEHRPPKGKALPELVELAQKAAAGGKAAAQLTAWLERRTPEGRSLLACCGVVSGILDHEALDAAEISDVLAPTVPEADGLLRLHRCTLVAIDRDDRVMDACRETVGISPYLIIPHAVLLHNEIMVDAADRELDQALTDPRARLRRLEAAHGRADLLLNRLHLPNVFNYRSERAIFREGAKERGSEERRSAALAKLAELGSRISARWEERRDRGQMWIAVLLAVISALQLKEVVFTVAGSGTGSGGWAALAGLALALAALIVLFWRQGIRR